MHSTSFVDRVVKMSHVMELWFFLTYWWKIESDPVSRPDLSCACGADSMWIRIRRTFWTRIGIFQKTLQNSNICTCIGAAADAKRLRKHPFSSAEPSAMWRTRYHDFIFYHYDYINAVSFENLLDNFKNVFNSIQLGVCLCEYAGDDWPLAMCRTHSLAISLTFSSLAITFFHRFGTFSFSVQKHFWMYLWNNFLRRFFMYCVTYKWLGWDRRANVHWGCGLQSWRSKYETTEKVSHFVNILLK